MVAAALKRKGTLKKLALSPSAVKGSKMVRKMKTYKKGVGLYRKGYKVGKKIYKTGKKILGMGTKVAPYAMMAAKSLK